MSRLWNRPSAASPFAADYAELELADWEGMFESAGRCHRVQP